MARSKFRASIDALKDLAFEEQHGTTQIIKEPIGVCALITPWNWPINQNCRQSRSRARRWLHDGC